MRSFVLANVGENMVDCVYWHILAPLVALVAMPFVMSPLNRNIQREYGMLLILFIFVLASVPFLLKSRAGIVAMTFEFVFMYASRHKTLIRLRHWLVIAVGLLLVFALVFSHGLESVWGRLLIYKVVVYAILENPLVGYGWDAFYKCYMLHQSAYFIAHPHDMLRDFASNNYFAFNEFLGIAYRYGILTLAVVICCICYLYKHSGNKLRASVIAVCVYSSFSYPFSFNPNKTYVENTYAMAARLNAACKYDKSDEALNMCEVHFMNYDTEMLRASNAMERGDYALAESHFAIAHSMIPNRFFPLYGLMVCYEKTGNPRMRTIARQIIDKPIKVESFHVWMVIDYANNILNLKSATIIQYTIKGRFMSR